ncbi:FAD dependent oxidoreductase, Putative taurine dehydrogenase large subunit [Cupriavidus phytorum]|uniref:Glycine/D-amino acid oxidase-like deaminating enzyme n=2 Tax=Cupriavidus TaxID=106589 RepID=A0A2W7PDV0_9BURK|nr:MULTISPECIES: FAD-binding oxidoreductase [Cupriavidus]PZX34424.1 glycine/D-amino acid oxidase-like deaminating enzyme [Cupriavidus alkaliphilus]SOY71632.1 FAD dependent oxidoreductase, Putative taurine dehydrogenase large subunit [Cupriavidus taiwanensis]
MQAVAPRSSLLAGEQSTAPTRPYDPAYDPLHTPTPGHGREYAPTYWIGTAGEPPADDGPITHDIDVDVAIIGSGFTGLTCAIFLAQEYGIKATVLEANRVSWGCSTRNGGQAQCASGRLKRSQWIQRYGLDTALRLHQEVCDGMETFKGLIKDIDCDPQPGGHLYIAHRDKVMPALEKEAKILREVFNYDARMLDADTVRREYVDDKEAAGAMHEPEGIGIHAGKLAFGYLRRARALGAKVHPSSPVTGWETRNGVHYLRTPGGIVRARAVGVATGGYTSQSLHRELKNRLFPILSNSIVTRPLTADELAACNFRTTQVITDTRILRHYYRLMPDGRLQIGSRSAITGNDAPQDQYKQKLIADMHRKFPALQGIQIDYSWWGWVDVSHDMMPRITQPDPAQSIYYAMGYGGNGVMYSAQAGKRLAALIAGKSSALPELPIFRSPLPFPNVREMVESQMFAPFRRLGQRVLYHWYHWKDDVL